MSRNVIVGNWKMNGLQAGGAALAQSLVTKMRTAQLNRTRMVLCPPATLLSPIAKIVMGSPVALGGQDCHSAQKGAYTGDISAEMLKDVGCEYVILGHSERRIAYNETNAIIREKAKAAIEAGLQVILCVGEDLASRERGQPEDLVSRQLRESLPINAKPANLSIAYEPIWAIGTGRTAGPNEIVAMLRALANTMSSPTSTHNRFAFLYGGSVKADNAAELSGVSEIDGFLVGGASLDMDAFWAIAQAMEVRKIAGK